MEINKIQIFDDIFSLEEQDNLEREIIKNCHFRWRSSNSKKNHPPKKKGKGEGGELG